MNHTELGATGELYVARLLSSAGLDVSFNGPADLMANGLPIEVKAARPGRYRSRDGIGYQFCLERDGHTTIKAPVVILLCYWATDQDPVAFVIPTERLGRRRKVVIPNDPWSYRGRWSRWFRRWETIADILEEVEQ